jgi:hypothetical protein
MISEKSHSESPRRARFVLVLVSTLSLLALLFPSLAAAAYEEVTEFGETGPVASGTAQLFRTWGAAVNYTGAGGVAPGTVYVARQPFGNFKGLRVYDSQGEFVEEVGTSSMDPYGVAVDQATGYLYVLRRLNAGQSGVVQILKPDGTVVSEFGELGNNGESAAEGPEKIHGIRFSGIAVDESGTVYVSDRLADPNFEWRVMRFEPETPGDYEHYVYAGRSHDVGASSGSTPNYYSASALSLDAAGHLYMADNFAEPEILEFDPSEPETPICSYRVPGIGQKGMTVNPLTGEVFYWSYKHPGEIFQLNPCNGEGKFTVKGTIQLARDAEEMFGLAINPVLSYEPTRPAGILYGFSAVLFSSTPGAISSEHAYGLIAVPAELHLPTVESESAVAVGQSTATIGAKVNPQGFQTRYLFQYETEAEYEANQPDETQSLTVSATGGLFSLAYGGRRYGGPITADLTSGSTAATALSTATGTANLRAAKGTANLKGANGTGTVISGSTAITAVSAKEGTFEAGQLISGPGLAAGTKVTAVKAGELTISSPAAASQAGVALSAGSVTLSSLSTSEGAFEVGQQVEGQGIPAGATIVKVEATKLTISKAPTKPGTGVAITAGFPTLVGVVTSEGAFEPGQGIEGQGIPAGTTISSVRSSELVLSKPVTKPGTSIAVSSTGPAPLKPGQAIEGPGIPAGTVIEAVKAGEVTLSNPAESTAAGAHLVAGLPFDAGAAEVDAALESLPAIGKENVEVTGGPGDEAGSSPYEIDFAGALANTDVEAIEAFSLGLSGGSESAIVATAHEGGNGFQGAAEAPSGGAEVGSGNVGVAVGASLGGLAPGTEYRFRVVATSHCNAAEEEQICEAVGAPKSFHTFSAQSPVLPDHRVWEMVSPPRKEGGEVWPANPSEFSHGCHFCKPGLGLAHFPMQSAPDGEAFVYQGYAFSGTEGNGNLDEYIARRSESGWQTTNLSPRQLGTVFQGFDDGLSAAVLSAASESNLSSDAPVGYANLYRQPTAEPGALLPLFTTAPPNREGAEFKIQSAGGSADLSKLIFEANDALTGETAFAPAAGDPGSKEMNLYAWSNGELSLVNVLPGNAASAPGAVLGSGEKLKHLDGSNRVPVIGHAISADGSRIFWSDESGQLYVREDGERTLEIPEHTGKFLTASADGSRVLLSDGVLYDLETEESTDLTEGNGGFQGIAGQSQDLAHVYFVDTAVLTAEGNEHGAEAQAGKDNLYAWDEGTVNFVATLVSDEGGLGKAWEIAPQTRSAEASPNGEWLAFLSRLPLTGQDTTGICREIGSSGSEVFVEGPCPSVFVYQAATGKLSCASCNRTGRLPFGKSSLELIDGESASSPQPQYLTDQGRLYFDSQDSLSPFDTNEGKEDVYEWEPQGVGSCESELVGGGCVSLISAGREPVDSNLLGVDETGKNVFFTTRDQLVLKDRDDLLDLYDAREGGGIAAESEVARGECQGEACQPPVSAPNDPTPASSNFEGAGNVVEKPAKKKPKHRHRHRRHRHRHGSGTHRAAKPNHGGAK